MRDFRTAYALLGPKIVNLVVVRSDDVGFPSIQLQKGRQRCSEKWMAKPVCVTAKRPPKVLGKVDGEARLRYSWSTPDYSNRYQSLSVIQIAISYSNRYQ